MSGPAGRSPDIEAVFRAEYGRCVANLVAAVGGLTMAEDAVQDAFVVAADRWARDGLPPNPGGWITTTARRRAIDRLRRESTRDQRQLEAVRMGPEEVVEVDPTADERLRLLFTCCHPALGMGARVALTLQLIAGLRTGEVARAFMVNEQTMSQRLVRAKRKISQAGIPYRVPDDAELPDRLAGVLAVVYLVFTEGHVATAGPSLVRDDLAEEAIRLGRVLATLMPDEPEVAGLLALMLLTSSRRPARVDASGDLVLLADQDRSRWDRDRIAEGHALVRRCLRRGSPGPYQLQAAINAVHCDAPEAALTDWRQILALYDQLRAMDPSPVVALNRAIALAEVAGPAAGLAEVEGLDLPAHVPWHATRADLLRRLGRTAEARAAYEQAAALATNAAERTFLSMQADALA